MTLLRAGFNVNAQVRYLNASDYLKNAGGITGLSVNILGPPRDEKFLAKMDPPAGQSYLRMDGSQSNRLDAVQPFAARWRLKPSDSAFNDKRLSHLKLSDEETKTLQKEFAAPSLNSLAFALDQAKNNTSLVTLLVFAVSNCFSGRCAMGELEVLARQGRCRGDPFRPHVCQNRASRQSQRHAARRA